MTEAKPFRIFIGYSGQARQLVPDIKNGILDALTKRLRHFCEAAQVLPVSLEFSGGEDARPDMSGQSKIKQMQDEADAAIFVFCDRIGKTAGDEIAYFRRTKEKAFPVQVFFPKTMPGNHHDPGVLEGWQKLLKKKQTLIKHEANSGIAAKEYESIVEIRTAILDGIDSAFLEFVKLRAKPCRQRILFLSSALVAKATPQASDSLDYFGILASEIAQVVGSDYDVVFRAPEDNTKGYQQANQLEEVLDNAHCYDALVLSPQSTKTLAAKIKKFMTKYPNKPLVTIDKSFEKKDQPVASLFEPPPSVTANGELGGEKAAKFVVKTTKGWGNVRAAVLMGKEGSTPREQGFRRYLKNVKPRRFRVTTIKGGEFDFLSARDTIRKQVLNARPEFDLVFCTNDEMALGVRTEFKNHEEAQRKAQKDWKWPKGRRPFVVGYDGIGAVKSYIDDEDEWIKATVDVRISDQVSWLGKWIRQFFEQPEYYRSVCADKNERRKSFKPRLYPRDDGDA